MGCVIPNPKEGRVLIPDNAEVKNCSVGHSLMQNSGKYTSKHIKTWSYILRILGNGNAFGGNGIKWSRENEFLTLKGHLNNRFAKNNIHLEVRETEMKQMFRREKEI